MKIAFVPLISFVLVTSFTPGPNNISCASMGVLCGYRKTLEYIAGIVSGLFVVMLTCAYLSSALLAVLPAVERYFRWIGACYILWMALTTLRSSYCFSESEEAPGAFTKGFLLQFFNPKLAVFGLTLYSTFLASISGRLEYLFFSAILAALASFAATSTWALFGAVIKNKLKNDSMRKAINAFLALLLVYTAVVISGIA
ncbi:MAG: LysE family translocator [Syntrophobacteraceae bacterium]